MPDFATAGDQKEKGKIESSDVAGQKKERVVDPAYGKELLAKEQAGEKLSRKNRKDLRIREG